MTILLQRFLSIKESIGKKTAVIVCLVFFTHGYAYSATENHGAIKWLEWEKESFQLSRHLDKPVFMYISAVWCMNCHIFEANVLSNKKISEYLKSNFITIRLDADEKPDIAERFVDRGLPTFAFLLPNGKIIVKGNNIPISIFEKNMRLVSTLYQENRKKIYSAIARREANETVEISIKGNSDHEYKIINDIDKLLSTEFDEKYGGFGTQSKFPLANNLEFLLVQYYLTKQVSYLNRVTKTLDNIKDGLYDDIEGGFYRYSTSRDWNSPHYEKMLITNSELLSIYLDVYSITQQAAYKDTALGTINFINNILFDKINGVFYTSQDAEDGSYYKLDKQGRAKRKLPHVDRRIFSSNNAHVAYSFIKAFKILNDTKYLDTAKNVYSYILATNSSDKQYIRHSVQDQRILLEDQITMANLGIALYEATGNREYIEKTEHILKQAMDLFWDKSEKGFYSSNQMSTFSEYNTQLKSKEFNSMAAQAYRKLYYLTKKSNYKQMQQQILNAIPEINGIEYIYDMALPKLATAALLTKYDPLEIKIVKGYKSDATESILSKVFSYYGPFTIISIYDPVKDKVLINKLGYPLKTIDIAYICTAEICVPASIEKYDSALKDIYLSILAKNNSD
jgi:uncharacterized protein YyaL (SSP411 family)